MALFVAVTLFVHEGKEEGFEAYEKRALARVAGHGGALKLRLRSAPRATGEQEPYEFHLLEFSSDAAFDAFVVSGVAYAEERDAVIARTVVVKGYALP